ncbi:MAG: hypothetical protein R3A45_11440 [Bdellovibrionota bacterium]
MKRMFVMCLCMGFMFCTSTGEENQEEESETIDITNAVLTSLSASCEDYVGTMHLPSLRPVTIEH